MGNRMISRKLMLLIPRLKFALQTLITPLERGIVTPALRKYLIGVTIFCTTLSLLFLVSCTNPYTATDTTIEPFAQTTSMPAPETTSAPQILSWQEAYAALLRDYAKLPLAEMDAGWSFFLHDINRSGVPELFLVLEYETGHVRYDAVYTFSDGKAVSLEFEGLTTDGGIFAPLDGSPWVVLFGAAGSGGVYLQMVIDGYRLITVADGWFFISEEGHEQMWLALEEGQDFDWQNYKWYDLSIGGNTATVEEFTNVFGHRDERRWFRAHSITENNINSVIFGCWESTIAMSTFQATDEIEISIAFATDAFLSKFESVLAFDDSGEHPQRIAFVPNVPVNNFRFIEINGAVIEYIVERDVYLLDTLLPENPLVVQWMARGSSPHRGIAFDDENNETRYFVFHYDATGDCWFRFAEFVGDLTLDCYNRWSLRHISSRK